MLDSSKITCLITTSPIPSNPSTEVIDETINSIRYHLPTSRIIVLCDGVRPELEHRSIRYGQYLAKLYLDPKINLVYTFNSHTHQSGMLKEVVPLVDTEYILFCEHDLPLKINDFINWQLLINSLEANKVHHIRFMLTPKIHPEHENLMLGPIEDNSHLLKTTQYSCWTNIASTYFWKRILKNLSPNAKCFIEPYCQGQVDIGGWDEYRLAIYLPDKENSQRIYHLDGRKTDPKFEELCVWS